MKAISFNGGKESLVILHKYLKDTNIIFRIEDKDDFPEIIDYLNYASTYFNINIIVFDNIKSAIKILKEKYNVDTVILGCRKTDPNCEKISEFCPTDEGWPYIMRHHPLLNWTYSDVWNYIDDNKLPVCSLYERGYTSIGNKNNTFPNYSLFSDSLNIYKHARELRDFSLERSGRIKNKLPIKISGKVIKGKGVGKKIGIPTANIDVNLDIDEGVYCGYCSFDDEPKEYSMVMSVGVNPQFGDKTVEVHILSFFNEDFYGKTLYIDICKFIRRMYKYPSLNELITAIKKDIIITKHLLN